MAKHETIADIIAEMRRNFADGNPYFAAGLPDRIEAAHKRELARVDAVIDEAVHGYPPEDIYDKRERGDCAKLREALKHIKDRLPHMLQYMRVHWEDASAGGYFDDLMLVIDAALSAPPRNCDVGTSKEQDDRFHRFCIMHQTGSCAGCHNPVGDYTAANGVRECALVWAQMPCEEGGAK